MKQLPAGLQAHLDSGTTTLAWCWRLTRRDGVTLGFTDHDRDLSFDGTVFEASAGVTPSEIKDSVGLSVDNLTIEGAINSTRLSEQDLAAGLYDDAKVEIFRVNWAEVGQRVVMRSGSLGDVRRAGLAFAAEIRGLAHYLQQPKGRLYQFTCDATFGDRRCGIDLGSGVYRANTTVAVSDTARRFTVAGLQSYAADWFTRGLCRVTSGANAGAVIEIKRHTVSNGAVNIELWQPLASAPQAGDALIFTAGCDKHFATCRDRFANAVNFRGMPHIPGNDFLSAVARPGDPTNNGQPRAR